VQKKVEKLKNFFENLKKKESKVKKRVEQEEEEREEKLKAREERRHGVLEKAMLIAKRFED